MNVVTLFLKPQDGWNHEAKIDVPMNDEQYVYWLSMRPEEKCGFLIGYINKIFDMGYYDDEGNRVYFTPRRTLRVLEAIAQAGI